MRNFLVTIALAAAGCEATAEPTLSPAPSAVAGSDAGGSTPALDAAADGASGPEGDAAPRRRQTEDTQALGDAAPPCDCDDGNPCTIDVCQTDGTCDTDLPAPGTACPGGVCQAGACVALDAGGGELADAGSTDAAVDTLDADLSPDNFSQNLSGADGSADTAVFQDTAGEDAALVDALVAEPSDVASGAAGDAVAGDAAEAGQALDAGVSEASGAGSDVGVFDALAQDNVAPDLSMDSGQPDPGALPICGCSGDSVALLGDCSVPAAVQTVGKVAIVPGQDGAGYRFAQGVSGPQSVALQVPGVDMAGDFTLQAWVRLAAHVDRSGIVSSDKPKSAGHSLDLYAHFAASNGVLLYVCAAKGDCGSIAGPALPIGTWAHVAVVRSAGYLRLFVQGQVCGTLAFDGNLSDALGGLIVGSGGMAADNHDLPGELDGVRISPAVLYWAAFSPGSTCL